VEGTAPTHPDLVLRVDSPDEWRIYTPSDRYLLPSVVEAATADLVRRANGIGVVGSVQDSDWAYAAGVTPEGVAARIIFQPEVAAEFEEGQDLLTLATNGPADDATRFSIFASLLGRTITPERIREIDEMDTPFAEDCLFTLLDEVGISVPEGVY
jgi:hypothetical protein